MENTKIILLHNITPEQLKDMIIADLKIEFEKLINQSNESQNYSVNEVAQLLNCSKQTVHSYIKKGLIPASKISRTYIIKKTDLNKTLKEVKSLRYRR